MPYHRLGLVARHRPAAWWRALIELVVLAALVAALAIASVIAFGVVAGLSGRNFEMLMEGSTDPLSPLVQILIIAAILPAPFLAARADAGARIFPEPQHYFRALQLTPLAQVRVVILGQDPYPTPGHANGLAFSVTPETALPRWRATWVDGRIAAEDVARDAHDAATPA